jgi:hypothetical protein
MIRGRTLRRLLRCNVKLLQTMTPAECRIEILKIIDMLPEELLPEISDLLKKSQSRSEHVRRTGLVKQILEEDAELFRRLAKYDSEL